MIWVENTTVFPRSRHSLMKRTTVRAAMTSRPLVGSSKNITGGSWSTARAIETRCFWPVESLSQRLSRNSESSSPPGQLSHAALQKRGFQPEQLAEVGQ